MAQKKRAIKLRSGRSDRPKRKVNKPPKSSVTAVGRALRALGGLGGGIAGGMLGNASLGSAAGSGLGAMVSRWLGQGDYTVTSNSLVSQVRSSGDLPNMHRNGQSVVVRHKEYITDVYSATTFAIQQTIALNPGLSSSFPWLSTIAQQYQEYTWRGIVFEFISTSGDVVASSNTALGSVMMATQYRATAPVYINKQQLLNEYFASDAKPSDCFCHPIECNPKENPYNVQYVRSGAVPSGEDQKTYDLGTTYLAAMGMQAASVDIGELWVSYEVELRKPVLAGALDLNGDAYIGTTTTGIAAATPFGTSLTVQTNTIAATVSSTTFTWPAGSVGTYAFLYVCQGTSAASLTNMVSGGTLVNCTASLQNNNNGANYTIASVQTKDTLGYTTITITNPALAASFQPLVTTLTGPAGMILRVFQIPPSAIF